MNIKQVLVYGAIAVAAGAMGAAFALDKKTPTPAPAPAAAGATAALFEQSMNDSHGVKQALAQWKGKPLVVNFWAPWCGPCVQEMPELSALATEQAAKGVRVIGIGVDSPTNIAQFGDKFKIGYPLYVAGMSGTDLARSFGNASGSLPYTVLIGADGTVKKTYLGKLNFAKLKADLAAM